MEISELSRNERVALVALMEAIALANDTVSEGERRQIDAVVEVLGEDEYRDLLEQADEKFTSLEDLKTTLAGIRSPEARALIFGTVWEEAVADADINHTETELLDWLAKLWEIPTEQLDAQPEEP